MSYRCDSKVIASPHGKNTQQFLFRLTYSRYLFKSDSTFRPIDVRPSFRKRDESQTRRCLTPSGLNWSGKSKAAGGSLRLTLVLFEFYLTSRQALTNSIPLSEDASDVSGFARSFRRRCSIRQGRADDVVRYTQVLRRPTIRLRLSHYLLPSLSLFLSLRTLPARAPPLCTLSSFTSFSLSYGRS